MNKTNKNLLLLDKVLNLNKKKMLKSFSSVDRITHKKATKVKRKHCATKKTFTQSRHDIHHKSY